MKGRQNWQDVLVDILVNPEAEAQELPLSLFRDITGNFLDGRVKGRGGFSVVYEGVLQNKMKVAVKRLLPDVDDAKFHAEVDCLKKLRHKNIVQFVGYCIPRETVELEGRKFLLGIPERLLCFEYVPSGTVQDHIADELQGLEWPKRYQIIRGICDGLYYMHNVMGLVHLDIKPSNILLDENMVPKIADFGTSRSFDDRNIQRTIHNAGTLGYMAPEYLRDKEISSKADVYSLGKIIFELTTGSKGPQIYERDYYLDKVSCRIF
jgi:serine/threonine protein kinase